MTGGEVGDEVADFFGGEAVEEAFGHHGDGGFLAGFDVAEGKREGFVGGLDGDGGGILFGDDALDDASVGEAEDGDFVFARNDAAGVEDVVEDVVEVVALATGEVGGDLGPFAEELVAGGAVFGEDSATVREVGELEIVGSELRFQLLGFGVFVSRGAADGAPDFGEAVVHALVGEGLELANRQSRHVLARHEALFDGVEQDEGEDGPRGEGLDGVLLFGGGKRGVGVEEPRGNLGRVVAGESADGVGTERGVLNEPE